MPRGQQLTFAQTPPVAPALPDAPLRVLAQQLPPRLYLGTSSWTFPGWSDLVYARQHTPAQLAQHGLAAYSAHPLLGCVGVDRTHYGPVDAATFAGWAASVPQPFRFLVKAHEACTLARYPHHRRYGKLAGEINPRFLDGAYASDIVVQPMAQGLGAHAGPLLFQLAPQDIERMGGPRGFVRKLDAFLQDLPKGPVYAVEVRNPELLTADYGAVLAEHGAVHCFNLWAAMPTLREQARILRAARFRALVVRWLLRPGVSYEDAVALYRPFNRLVDENPVQRADIVWLTRHALAAGNDATIIVNNKAEGCAPLSIIKLAQALTQGTS